MRPPSPRLLFFGFLLAGLASGFFIGSLRSAMAAPLIKQPAAQTAQHNSLIVLVDDLKADQPSLRGIWLAARSGAEIVWMPIYPQPLHGGSNYAQPHSELRLASGQLGAVAQLAPLRAAGVWFDEVFLADQAALGALGAAAGASQAGLRATWAEPQAALQEQVEFIQALCTAAWGDAAQLEAGLALMPAHLYSSTSPFDLITRWDTWAQVGFGLTCSHPWAD